MISQLVYLVCFFCLIIKFLQRNSKKSTVKPPEFSGAYPIIGHSWKILGERKNVLGNIKSLSKECLENGGILLLNIGLHSSYLISDPEDCLKVANECLQKDFYYSFAKPFLGNGLLTADVSIWKTHRKLMNPAFRQKNINNLLVMFNRQAKYLTEQFKPELGRGEFNPEKYIRLNNLESICMSSFGANAPEIRDIEKEYLHPADEILDIFVQRFQKFWLHNNFIYNWSNLKKRQDKCVESLKRFSYAILDQRKLERKGIENSLNGYYNYTPFMSNLFKISEKTNHYSEEDILYETNTIIAAGYDTSSVTLTLVLILLGSHPEVQKKVYEELKEVFNNSDRDIGKEDLPKLVYLDAVIKEAIRLYPIAPIISRHLTKDIQLRNYTLKAGKSVTILIWALHRHPVWGLDCETFRPERWLDGSLPSNPNAFGGFSIGKRACIGKAYALMSIKTVISHLLRKYEVISDIKKLELEVHGSLRLAAGQMICIKERTSTGFVRNS